MGWFETISLFISKDSNYKLIKDIVTVFCHIMADLMPLYPYVYIHSCLNSLSHCVLIMVWRVELVHENWSPLKKIFFLKRGGEMQVGNDALNLYPGSLYARKKPPQAASCLNCCFAEEWWSCLALWLDICTSSSCSSTPRTSVVCNSSQSQTSCKYTHNRHIQMCLSNWLFH